MLSIEYHRGTILLNGYLEAESELGFVHDDRVGKSRAAAIWYRDLLVHLNREQIPFSDEIRAYSKFEGLIHTTEKTPRDYQSEAVEAWSETGRRGVVVLPTGSGKSFVAELIIAKANRSTLILVPTIDLVNQWYGVLSSAFNKPIGMLGGGEHTIEEITVSTYDSAYIHADKYGNRFGLIVYDEVHHLPSAAFSQTAEMYIAPMRLGLSATPERTDDAHNDLPWLVGPIVYRKEISDLRSGVLADYTVEKVDVELTYDETVRYNEARSAYTSFIGRRRIYMGGPNGWGRFMQAAAQSKDGRAALRGHRESREIMHQAAGKLDALEDIIERHPAGRVLIFTNDNHTAYRVSREFLVPCITHQTPTKERKGILSGFGDGEWRVIVTSRVLNEGVDMPAADVGVVISGTSTVREHVQRLGRILRPKEGKSAVLYELITVGTKEVDHSDSRRKHNAYSGTD
jgi:superfamily II DNA or RNA helicase